MPETQFRSVLLPAPFGPMRPTIAPDWTSKLTSRRAWMPPKSTETFSIDRCDISAPPPETTRKTPQALRHHHHDNDEQETEHQTRRILDAAQEFGNDDIEAGADNRTADRAKPADHDHAEECDRKPDTEIFRMNVANEIRKQAAGDGRIEGADRKRDHLVARGRNAKRAGRDLALFDDQERAAGAAAAEIPCAPDPEHHQRHGQVIKTGRAQFMSGDLRRIERKPATAIGQPAPFEDDLLQHHAET